MNDDQSSSPASFNLVDLFAGVGGISLGFTHGQDSSDVQFKPRLLVDHDPEAGETFARNLPSIPYLVEDVHRLSGAQVRERAGLGPRDELHVLVGGPPCQGFSWLGRQALDDPRNVHVLDFLRMVKELRPLVALIENVPLIVTSHNGQVMNEIFDGLERLGYSSSADILVASDYGVPQLRKRAFVLAYRSDLGQPPSFPRRTHERVTFATDSRSDYGRVRFEEDRLPYVSVEEAIGDLPALKAGEGDEVLFYSSQAQGPFQVWARAGSVAIFNHRSRAHSKEFLKKISVITEGGRNTDLPDDQRFSDNYYSQAYARLHRAGIAQTITTCFGNPGSGRFMHYRDLRAISVREGARLQAFPDSFVFHGHHSSQMRHVGNAVPPMLALALRNQIAKDLMAAGAGQAKPVGRPRKIRVEEPEERSRIMRAVTSKNTGAELVLRRALQSAGIRGYRLHSRKAPGQPDVLFGKQRTVVFVDGCFWHGCPKCYRAPKTHSEYWRMKVKRNVERDAQVTKDCKAGGWHVLRVWEHEVLKHPERVSRKVKAVLTGTRLARERKTDRPSARVLRNIVRSEVEALLVGGIRRRRPR
jgi:DNA (cytosine-5)-methyltransferase 1